MQLVYLFFLFVLIVLAHMYKRYNKKEAWLV